MAASSECAAASEFVEIRGGVERRRLRLRRTDADAEGVEQTQSPRLGPRPLSFNRRARSALTVHRATAAWAMYGGVIARMSFRRGDSTGAALPSMAIFDLMK
jgi:hypothetical protein